MVKGPVDSGWFEISPADWLGPRFKGKELKLLADASVPDPVIEEIIAAGITVKPLPPIDRSRSDSDVLARAQHEGVVLLTLDSDFWNDTKHPLHMLRTGIVYVAVPPGQTGDILRAFGLVYGCFAKEYPLDWWNGIKVRARPSMFDIKLQTWEGKVARYRMKLRRGRLEAKEL